jgi:chromosome segregation ATPase
MDAELRAYLDELRAHVDRQFSAVNAKLHEHDAQFAAIRAKLEEHDLRFDQHDRRFDDHDRRFDDHDRRFDDHDRRFDDHDRRFDLRAAGLFRIEQRVERLESGWNAGS